jgi:LEA14-like dessication related protein
MNNNQKLVGKIMIACNTGKQLNKISSERNGELQVLVMFLFSKIKILFFKEIQTGDEAHINL